MLKIFIIILSLTAFSKYDFSKTLIDFNDSLAIYRFDLLLKDTSNVEMPNDIIINQKDDFYYVSRIDTLQNIDQEHQIFSNIIKLEKVSNKISLSDPLIYDWSRNSNNQTFMKVNFRDEFIGFEPTFNIKFNILNKNKLSDLLITVNILDAVERLVKKVKIPLPSKNGIIPIDIKYTLAGIPTGSYYLTLDLKQNDTLIGNITKPIFIVSELEPKLNTNLTDNELFEKSIFYTLNEEQVIKEINQIRLLANNSQNKQFRLLTDIHAKRRALYKYWKQQDVDDDPFINKKRLEFEKAVEHANRNFSYGSSETNGWDTDRGRILLRYGFPMFFDNSVARAGQPSSEIWFYGDLKGGTYFYFVDLGNYNNYTLVHSTLRSEVQNEHWIEDYNPAIDDPELIVRDLQYLENFNNGR